VGWFDGLSKRCNGTGKSSASGRGALANGRIRVISPKEGNKRGSVASQAVRSAAHFRCFRRLISHVLPQLAARTLLSTVDVHHSARGTQYGADSGADPMKAQHDVPPLSMVCPAREAGPTGGLNSVFIVVHLRRKNPNNRCNRPKQPRRLEKSLRIRRANWLY
jgi:hypothetical protein